MSQHDGPQGDPERGEFTGRLDTELSPRHASGSENLDEFGQLFKYVSTYREQGEGEEEGDGEVVEKRVWFAPWKKRKVRARKAGHIAGRFPEEWRLTDIRQGLSSDEVSNRRRRSGWNELVSEKENPIVKIIGYFRGPILYGKPYSMVSCEHVHFLTCSQSWNWPSCFPRVWRTGLTLASSSAYCVGTLRLAGTKKSKRQMLSPA